MIHYCCVHTFSYKINFVTGRRFKRSSSEITGPNKDIARLLKRAVSKFSDNKKPNDKSDGLKTASGPSPVAKGIYPITSTGKRHRFKK